MKKFTKILSIVMAMVLCVGVGVGATLAWLTADTEEVVNTFSAPNLIDPNPDPEHPDDNWKSNFEIWEHFAHRKDDGTYELLNKDSKLVKDLTKQNTYDVVPGSNLPKDPFVQVKVSESAYIFMEAVGTLPATMEWSIDTAETWNPLMNAEGKQVTGPKGGLMYVHKNIITPKDGTQYLNIMTGKNITVDSKFEPNTLTDNTTLTFYAYATQSVNLGTALNAWTSTYGAPTAPVAP